jgi:hypothetical protein
VNETALDKEQIQIHPKVSFHRKPANPLNSASESSTGIGVVAGFLAGVGMMESSHMQRVEFGP